MAENTQTEPLLTEALWTIRWAGPPAPTQTVTTTELEHILRGPRAVFDVVAVPRTTTHA